MHPRSRHQSRYDLRALAKASPELAPFVAKNAHGDESVDFANPAAVLALNRAILKGVYGVAHWNLPEGYLCPPIPGRADYLHHLADLLAVGHGGKIPRGAGVRVLDVGVGANCVYPLLGVKEYGWSFVGSDTDAKALANARTIVHANGLGASIELRLQRDAAAVFRGAAAPGESFAACVCNPPFHASREEAREASARKWKNLGKAGGGKMGRNFGGVDAELWCEGGEAAFACRMIEESAKTPTLCSWFTLLLSKEQNLPRVYAALKRAKVPEARVIGMEQGQKVSRVVAWTYRT